MEASHWTVSELNNYVRTVLETDYRLQDLTVKGEVSNWRVPGSGHAYFTLKDAHAQIDCVMWKNDVKRLRFYPQDGDGVIAHGRVSLYEVGGRYQLYCQQIEKAGAGKLYLRFEELKNKLEKEGLFDTAAKRPLPQFPHKIGVVTSPSAAALQDVLNVLRRRYPIAHVILSPTSVQGETASLQIVAALKALSHSPNIDVLLIVRGGGSLEDLWCFNDEHVVRAVSTFPVPVISGVGHETDFTLTDFAADVRAPTPSAAAEIATPFSKDILHSKLDVLYTRQRSLLQSRLAEKRLQVKNLVSSLQRLTPHRTIADMRQHLDLLDLRAHRVMQNHLSMYRNRVIGLQRILTSLDPRALLSRGFTIVTREDGTIVTQTGQVHIGDKLIVSLRDGNTMVRVEEIKRE